MKVLISLLVISYISLVCSRPRCANKNISPRIAVGFFGISRSLEFVMPTLQRHLFDVLDRSHITYDVLTSTNAATETVNTRAGQGGVTGGIDQFDVSNLEPCLISLSDQELVRLHEWVLFAHAHGIPLDSNFEHNTTKYAHLDEFKDNMVSIKNLLCAYHSMNVLLEMIEAHQVIHKFTYDAVFILRPDTALLRDIDLPQHMDKIKQEPLSIWIPGFQLWGGYNDRAAFGSLTAISVYLKRGKTYRDSPVFHRAAERLVKNVLDANNITVYNSTMRVARVRQHGVVFEAFRVMDMEEEEWNRCIVQKDGRLVLAPTC